MNALPYQGNNENMVSGTKEIVKLSNSICRVAKIAIIQIFSDISVTKTLPSDT